MVTSKYTYQPRSISVISSESLDSIFSFNCSNHGIVNDILNSLTSMQQQQQQQQSNFTASYSCDNNQWIVANCVNTPTLCINCQDACSGCKEQDDCASYREVVVSPCVDRGISSSNRITALSLSYTTISPAPTLSSVQFIVSKTSIQVKAVLSSSGSLYGAVFRSNSSTITSPSSIDSIILQNFVATVSGTISTIIMTGLDAATFYNIYFLTISPNGIQMSFDIVLKSKQILKTLCCKELISTLSSKSIVLGQSVPKIITITIPTPSTSLKIQINLYTMLVVDGNKSLIIPSEMQLYPSIINLDSISLSTIYTASLPAMLHPGLYQYSLSLSGDAMNEYSITYLNSQQIHIISSVSGSPPAPNATQAIFSNDGSYIIISYDSVTNRGELPTHFSCNLLFEFDGISPTSISTSTCRWVDSATIHILIGSSAGTANQSIRPGSYIIVLGGKLIQAKCLSSSCPYDEYVVRKRLIIQSPVSPITPIISISVSSVVGECDDIVLDLSGSSGSGGRDWVNQSLSVISLSNENGTLLNILHTHLIKIKSLTPAVVPNRLLSKGSSYNFMVKLCNFLNQCSMGSKQIVVLNYAIPNVVIPGPSLRSGAKNDTLLLSSYAFVASCTGDKMYSGLQYSWSISSNNVPQFSIISISKDPSKLLLPSYSLKSNTIYDISLSVTTKGSSLFSSTSVKVYVTVGNVFAIIEGGGVRTIRIDESLVLNGLRSYDEDQEGELSYHWSCIQISPSYINDCLRAFSVDSLILDETLPLYELTPINSAINVQCMITLTIVDATLTRSSQATVSILILPSLSPVVTLNAPYLAASGIMNAGSRLQLIGSLSVPASTGGYAQWSIDDNNIDLSTISLTTLDISIPVDTSNSNPFSSTRIYLTLMENSLPVGISLTFTLIGQIQVNSVTTQTSTSIVVLINAPPTPGLFQVSPLRGGYALSDSFTFLATQWVDTELPLNYQFSYTSNTMVDIVLISKGSASYGMTKLTSGSKENNHLLNCVAQIYDSLNANTSISLDIEVLPTKITNSTEVASFISSSFSQLFNADSIKQSIAFSTSLLNTITCPPISNCSALHRNSCLRTPHTCGTCESSLYVGKDGDSNEPCILKANYSSQESLFGRIKSCPNDCSGHGTCIYVEVDTGALMVDDNSCIFGNSGCEAVCECTSDYFGSDACDISTIEFIQRQASRDYVINGLQSLMALENPDADVITGWTNSLFIATQNVAEISDTSIDTVLGAVQVIISTAAETSYSPTILSTLLTSTNAAVKSMIRNVIVSNRRNLRNLSSVSTHTNSLLISSNRTQSTIKLIESFTNLLSNTMTPGQKASEFIQSQFRLSSQVIPFGLASHNVSSTVPRTTLEEFANAPSSSVIIPNILQSSSSTTDSSGLSVSITSLHATLFNHLHEDFKSNPLTLLMPVSPCDKSSSECNAHVTLKYTKSIKELSTNYKSRRLSTEYHNKSCTLGEYTTSIYNCSDGYKLSIACNGTAGVMKRQCPSLHHSSTCNAITGKEVRKESSSGCQLHSYTESNISCICNMQSMSTSNTGATEQYSVSYVSMLKSTYENFVSTIISADSLNASTVTKSWISLVTVGSLFIGIIIALMWSHYTDHEMKKVKPHGEEVVHDKSRRVTENYTKQPKKKNHRFKMNKAKVINRELELVENSLPQALSSRSFTDRCIDEIKHHHRWLGIIFYFTEDFPRMLRVSSLATNMIIMLFMQSLTYNLTNPDDGSCESFKNTVSCEAARSPYSTGDSKCIWLFDTDQCKFIEPSSQIKVVLFVAIFCAIVSTPIALLIDWIIMHIIAAPTLQLTPIDSETMSMFEMKQLSSVVIPIPADNSMDMTSSQKDELSIISVFQELLKQIQLYRSKLSKSEAIEFNELWGLDENGDFNSSRESNLMRTNFFLKMFTMLHSEKKNDVKKLIFQDLKNVKKSIDVEAALLRMKKASNREIGRRLLFLFQCDLLPGISGKILELKGSRDNPKILQKSTMIKLIGWTSLLILNVLMLFYILLFAFSQTGPRQSAWFKSFAIWLAMEIIIVSTSIVLISHIFIPMLIMKDLAQIKMKLIANIREYQITIKNNKENEIDFNYQKNDENFNAANYLFISTGLSKLFPSVKESKIIAQFTTPWPKQSYCRVEDVSKQYSKKFSALTRSASILIIFFAGHFLNMPSGFQDMIIHILNTTVVGYVILIHIQLYQLFPVLVILPLCIIGVIVHFIITSGKADAKIRLAKLFPVNTTTIYVTKQIVYKQREEDPTTQIDLSSTSKGNIHQTRRASIQIGLNVINEIQQMEVMDDNDDNVSKDCDDISFENDSDENESEDSDEIDDVLSHALESGDNVDEFDDISYDSSIIHESDQSSESLIHDSQTEDDPFDDISSDSDICESDDSQNECEIQEMEFVVSEDDYEVSNDEIDDISVEIDIHNTIRIHALNPEENEINDMSNVSGIDDVLIDHNSQEEDIVFDDISFESDIYHSDD